MEFLTALFGAILCIAGGFLIIMFVFSFITIASAIDKIAKAFVKWCERN